MATISTGTVNSRYSRHSGKRHLVSAVVRVLSSTSLKPGFHMTPNYHRLLSVITKEENDFK